MKKLLLLFASIIFISQQSFAQAWTDVGLKLGGGTSWLIDQNIFDDNTYVHDFSGAYNFGAKASLNLGERHSISFEAMLSNQRQNFDYGWTDDSGVRIEGRNEVRWSNVDLYFLYRYYSQGAFSEFGIMRAQVRSVEHFDPVGGFPQITDVTNNYQDYFSAVFGGGAFVAGSERSTLMLGIRIHFALTDFISEAGMSEASLAEQDLQFAFPNPFRNDFTGSENNPYADPRITRPILIELLAEYNFGIGYFARTICSGRIKWFGG